MTFFGQDGNMTLFKGSWADLTRIVYVMEKSKGNKDTTVL